jgi:nitroreductase
MTVPAPTEWLSDLVLSRTTVHDYSPEPIPDSLIERALELALAAPNHRLTEPWRFVEAGPVVRQRLADISVALKRQKGPLGERAEFEIKAKVVTPPVLLVLCRVRNPRPDVEREDYAAIACAVQNAVLWLWSQGIGAKWSTGGVISSDDTYQALAIPRDEQEIVGFLWVGRPAKPPVKPKRERALPDVFRRVP